MATDLGMDSAAERSPAVAIVVLEVVAVIEQAAPAVQVVVHDCLVSWGERLVLHHSLPTTDVFAHHLEGDSVRPEPGDERAVAADDGLALRRESLHFGLEHVIDDGGERVEP
jgi:hypothetical protein